MWKVDDKIKFVEYKKYWTVQACNKQFLICTQPFNLKHTVLYTIVDLVNNIRGTENLVFCMGFETKEQCEEALQRLQKGISEISFRNRVPLRIRE